jgi:predicted signal transduction protein with EAL and GGDEF domain
VEPGYLNDPAKFSTLRSALALPLEGVNEVIGVLALYRAERDAFTSDDLRILLAVGGKMALATENALKYEQAESSATTDYLTGLPNARSLFLQLDRELARCKRDNISLTLMVCDMNGFKKINDRFGHLEGNRVLRLFSQALKDSCRDHRARTWRQRCRQETRADSPARAPGRLRCLWRRYSLAQYRCGRVPG